VAGAGLTALGDARIANLDTQISALPTAAENATELLDQANGVETGVTVRKALRAIAAESAGDVTGTVSAPVFGAIANAATPRITAAATDAGLRTNTLSLT
ncbi:MAG: hypothetical protein NUW21_04555, partial [Elusimicrobia bacterium]|nr:hypothetical protein [Elusimicrobiota bacterium]